MGHELKWRGTIGVEIHEIDDADDDHADDADDGNLMGGRGVPAECNCLCYIVNVIDKCYQLLCDWCTACFDFLDYPTRICVKHKGYAYAASLKISRPAPIN